MNFKTTIVLLVLLIGAGTFFILGNLSDDVEAPAKTPDSESAQGRKLFDVAVNDVKKLVITPGPGAPANAQPVELSKVENNWKIVRPIDWAADSFEGGKLVETIANLRSSATIDITEGNTASTGLTKPRYTIELTDSGGKVHKLAVGEKSVLGRLYVQTEGETKTASVVTGSSLSLSDKLAKGTNELVASIRDKQLLKVTTFDVQQMQIDTGGKKVSLVRGGNGWTVTEPQNVPGDTAEVSDILTTITNLRADEFTTEAEASSSGASFDQPRAVVTLSTAPAATQPSTAPATGPAPKTVTVVIGQATDISGGKTWVKISEPASIAKVALAKPAFEKIADASPMSLRSRKIFDVDPEQVAEVVVKTEASSATQPTEPKTIKLERRKEVLEMGPQLPGSTTAPATKPAATQPASGPSTQPATQPASKPTAWMMLKSLLMPTAMLQAGGSEPPPNLPPELADMVARMQAERGQQPGPQEPAAPTGPSKWVRASANGADADDIAVSSLLFDLHPLKATKFLDKMPPATQPTTGPTTQPVTTVYVLTVKTIAPGGQAQNHEVRITDRGTGAPIAQYQNLIFEVERTFVDKLKGDFAQKAAPKPAAPVAP